MPFAHTRATGGGCRMQMPTLPLFATRYNSRAVGCCAGFLVFAVSLCGCTPLTEYIHNGFKVGPNYGKPPAPVAPTWIDAADRRVRSETEDLSKWWTVFHDPVLDSLVCSAYRQ